jgi:hypothetical protein
MNILTELFVCSLLAPAAYDIIKTIISRIAKCVTGFFRIRDTKEAKYPHMKMKIGNAKIIAPIPCDLSDKQFSNYMNTLQGTLKTLSDNEVPKIEKYDCFIVEYSEYKIDRQNSNSQYGLECAAEQRRRKEEQNDKIL